MPSSTCRNASAVAAARVEAGSGPSGESVASLQPRVVARIVASRTRHGRRWSDQKGERIGTSCAGWRPSSGYSRYDVPASSSISQAATGLSLPVPELFITTLPYHLNES